MPSRDRHSRPPSPGSVPRTVTSPLSRRRYPSRISTVVVLPAPFGPSRAKTSPCRISRSTPSTATVSPYDLRSPLTRTLAVVSMTPASGHGGAGTTTGRPDPPSTVRWTPPGERRQASCTARIASGKDPITSPAPIGASPPGCPPAPPAAYLAEIPCRYAAAAAASPAAGPWARSGPASPASTSPVPAVASQPVPVGLTSSGPSPPAITVVEPLSSTQQP